MRKLQRERLSPATFLVPLALSGFLALVLVVLERIGLPNSLVMTLAALALLGLFLAAALLGATARPSRFFGGTRPFGAVSAATAAFSMVLGLAAARGGFRPSTLLVPAETGALLAALLGLVPAALLFAPLIRRSGAYSLPEFLSHRFEAVLPRLIAYLLLLAVLAPVVLALAAAAFAQGSALLGWSPPAVAVLLIALAGAPLLIGGVRSARASLLVLFVCLIVGLALPLAAALLGNGLQLAAPDRLDALLASADALLPRLLPAAGEGLSRLQGAVIDGGLREPGIDPAGFASLVLGLSLVLLASAGLVQLPSARSGAGASVLTGLLLIVLPAVALLIAAGVLVGLETGIVGQTATTVPQRFQDGSLTGLLRLCGGAPTAEAMSRACASGLVTGFRAAAEHRFALNDITIDPALLGPGAARALGLPGVAILLYRVLPFLVLVAALSLASFALSAALAHDGLLRLVRRRPIASMRLALARLATLGVIAAAVIGVDRIGSALPMLLDGALALAGATLMPLLAVALLPRAGSRTALLTLLGGLSVAAVFLVFGAEQGGDAVLRAGLYGAVGALAMAGAGLASCPPGQEEARFAAALLKPAQGPLILDPAA